MPRSDTSLFTGVGWKDDSLSFVFLKVAFLEAKEERIAYSRTCLYSLSVEVLLMTSF